jgi:tetratricopeptide (TPR) repeat protein
MVNSFQEAGQSLFNNWNIDLDEVSFEQLDHYIAVKNYLMDEDKPSPNAENIEKVKGLLEAFYHLCDVEDWERAEKLLFVPLNTPTREELHNQLGIWGYYRQQIELYTKLLGEVIYSQNTTFLNALANAYFTVGNYNQAIHYHNHGLAQEQKSGNQEGEAISLKNLGVVYYSMGDYISAIQLFEKSLEINKELKDLHGEATVLGELGSIYHDKGNYVKAIEYWQKTLEIMQKFKDFAGEGGSLVNLGVLYKNIENFDRAIELLQQGFEVFSKIDNLQGQGKALNNLGGVYFRLKNYDKALELYQKRLEIAKRSDELEGELVATGNLANIYYKLGEHEKAMNFYQKSLNVAKIIRNRLREGLILLLDSGKFSSRVSEKRKSDMRYPRVPLCPKLADIENR